jgi:hypothetical protein
MKKSCRDEPSLISVLFKEVGGLEYHAISYCPSDDKKGDAFYTFPQTGAREDR